MFKRLTIGGQLWAFVGIAALAVAVVGAAGSYAALHAAQALEHGYRHALQPLVLLNRISTRLQETKFRMAAVQLDQMPIEGSKNHALDTEREIPQLWETFTALAKSGTLDEEKGKLLEQAEAGEKQLEAFLGKLVAAYGKNDKKALEPLLEDEWPQVHMAFVKVLDRLIAHEEELGRTSFERNNAMVKTLTATAIAAAIASLALLIGGAFLFIRLLSGSLAGVSSLAERIAGGDLSADPRALRRQDAIGDLYRAMAKMIGGLRATIGAVHATAGVIATASQEIATGNVHLSKRTDSQASSLEETAASMEELTRSVQENADAARRANQLVLDASGAAENGGKVVAGVVGTMDTINESAKKIAEIVGIIDGIAFQTNILALNAAVEAARAGDHGRGFAVVAAEVRSLAQRAAAGARDIRQQVADSTEKAELGARMARDAGRSMEGIIGAVKTVTSLIGHIAAASQKQSAEIGAVSRSIAEMDTITQQNAALVEQAAAATGSLEQQSRNLVETAGVFKLSANETPAPAAALSDQGARRSDKRRALIRLAA